MANTKIKVVLGMFSLKYSNINILFDDKILIWRFYTINKALFTIKQI